MNRHFLLLAVLLLSGFFVSAQLTPVHLLCENLPDPLCIDATQPRLSWQSESGAKSGGKAQRGLVQTAYEIKVTDGDKPVWNTGKMASDQSVHVEYAGQPLESGKLYHWQVRVWDGKGAVSKWSEAGSFR